MAFNVRTTARRKEGAGVRPLLPCGCSPMPLTTLALAQGVCHLLSALGSRPPPCTAHTELLWDTMGPSAGTAPWAGGREASLQTWAQPASPTGSGALQHLYSHLVPQGASCDYSAWRCDGHRALCSLAWGLVPHRRFP